MDKFTWKRTGGYECSSKGDRRFSAFNALMPDGRSIELHYQCDIKGYDPGGYNWKLGKGKPPLDPTKDLWAEYFALWEQWALAHPDHMYELGEVALREHNGVISDMFAWTPISQARALAELLNKYWED